MDSFNEQLVVRKNTGKHVVKLVVLLLLIFSAPAIFFLLGVNGIGTRYFVIVAVCAFFFAVYGSYYLVTGMYVEYEYAVTNSNLTIDRITAKRSRKRIISVDIKKLNTLRKLKDAELSGKNFRKYFNASVTENGDDVYAAEMHLEKFNGDCLLLFSPDEIAAGWKNFCGSKAISGQRWKLPRGFVKEEKDGVKNSVKGLLDLFDEKEDE